MAAIVVLAIATMLAVDPRGDFPLDGDWCYAQAVRHLVTRGEVRPVDLGSMALLTQLLWGGASAPRDGTSCAWRSISTGPKSCAPWVIWKTEIP